MADAKISIEITVDSSQFDDTMLRLKIEFLRMRLMNHIKAETVITINGENT